MKTRQVELGERSYPIYIGDDLLGDADLLRPHIRGQQVMVVSNETVAPLYLEKTRYGLRDYDCASVVLPDGEEYKNLDILKQIYDALLENHFNRQCTLIALGGGVIGDMTGFAAASYQRGVDFIQIPTTLLSQVDSSVGGKTGINHPLGKNMIGAFHQPRCVIADTNSLDTLDDRQLSAGIAEIIKYGLLGDADFFDWLEANMDNLMSRNNDALVYAIERSCQDKADVVAADERESGKRALLNLGHTFGHAIEACAGYGNWLHGEAVGTGMLMAADLSMRMGWIDKQALHRTQDIIERAALPIRAPSYMDYEHFMERMSVDKKVRDGKINFILLKAIGDAVVTNEFNEIHLRETIEAHRALAET